MDLYADVSGRIRRILDEFTPVVEPLSIDEAFLDLTGVVPDLGKGIETGRRLKEAIRERERLTASVGVAPNKFLAKVASDLEKPDGLVSLPIEAVPERLWPLPVRALWGVGPKTAEALNGLGLKTVGDILRVPRSRIASRLGEGAADHLRALAAGKDDRPVDPSREAKSLSEERTYAKDIHDAAEIDRQILSRAEGVARSLRDAELQGWTVHLKVRAGDFTTWTRSATLAAPTCFTEEIHAVAAALFRERIGLGGRGVRLIGVGVSNLEPAAPVEQPDLFPDPERLREERSARAEDAVRHLFGEAAITRARLLRRKDEDETSPAASSLPSL
jgi:DNA polymerase-4